MEQTWLRSSSESCTCTLFNVLFESWQPHSHCFKVTKVCLSPLEGSESCHVVQRELLWGLQKRLKHPLCSSSCFLPEPLHPHPYPYLSSSPLSEGLKGCESYSFHTLCPLAGTCMWIILCGFHTVKAWRGLIEFHATLCLFLFPFSLH